MISNRLSVENMTAQSKTLTKVCKKNTFQTKDLVFPFPSRNIAFSGCWKQVGTTMFLRELMLAFYLGKRKGEREAKRVSQGRGEEEAEGFPFSELHQSPASADSRSKLRTYLWANCLEMKEIL